MLAKIKEIFRLTVQWITQRKILDSSYFIFACGGLLGTLFFICIFGTKILDCTYTDWLMAGYRDLTQHYTGWAMFRNSAWYFPLGLMDNIVYPFKISIIYTDSIPLFALFFKLLSPILPENFQYFGLFGILCYMLQGGIGALIVRKIGGNTVQSIIGSVFFILSTVMMWRLYHHTALAAHFIILLCILVCLEKDSSLKKRIITWGGLFALSVAIHSFFVPMVAVFMFASLLRECIITKKIVSQCIVFGASLLILFGTMFCLGAFYFVNDLSSGGLGRFSANLNSFVNPQGMSYFIKDLPVVPVYGNVLQTIMAQAMEGQAYLGLGIILFLCFIVICQCIRVFLLKDKRKLKADKKEKLFPYILGAVLFFWVFALSPTVTLNQHTLFTYPVIKPVEYLWSMFRSTGRMTWPVIYIAITVCIWWAITQFSTKRPATRNSIILISIFLLVQWADLSPYFLNKGKSFKTKIIWKSELSSPEWDNLASNYKHILFTGVPQKLWSFIDFAVKNKMTVNHSYLSRTNVEKVNDNIQKEMTDVLNNKVRTDTIYVFQNKEQAAYIVERPTAMQFYIIDDVIIGIKEPGFESKEEIQKDNSND